MTIKTKRARLAQHQAQMELLWDAASEADEAGDADKAAELWAEFERLEVKEKKMLAAIRPVAVA